MEEAIQYIIKELQNADNKLTTLSVMSALHDDFMTKETSCKVAASTKDLVKCLFEILKDEFSVYDDNKTEDNNKSKKGHPQTSDKTCEDGRSKSHAINTVENLLKVMTLSCVYEFSKDRENVYEVGVPLQKTIMSFFENVCDLDKSRYDTDNFRYSPNFTKCIQKFVSSKVGGKVKVKIVFEKNDVLSNLSSLKRYLEYYNETETADHIQGIRSNDSPLLGLKIISDESPELTDLLINQKVAWGRGSKYRSGNSQSKENKGGKKASSSDTNVDKNKTDAHVAVISKVLNGNLFWVNVGEESVANVERINSMLEMEHESNSLKHCKQCNQNDVVAAFVNGSGDRRQLSESQCKAVTIRVKILSVNLRVVTVFGVDVGGVYRVPKSSIFNLPTEVNISVIPQQVDLAYLYDVSPPAMESPHVELPVAIMGNFCRSIDFSKVFVEKNCLCLLPALIGCGDTVIANQAVRLATAVTRNVHVDCSNHWCDILVSTLDCLNKLVQEHIAGEELNMKLFASGSATLSGKANTTSSSSVTTGVAQAKQHNCQSQSLCNKEIQRQQTPDKQIYGPSKGITVEKLKSPTTLNKSVNETSERISIDKPKSQSPGKKENQQQQTPDKQIYGPSKGIIVEKSNSPATPNKSFIEKSEKNSLEKGNAMTDASASVRTTKESNRRRWKLSVDSDKTLIAACLRLLGNFIHKNQEMKEVVYQQNGLETVLICQRILGNQPGVMHCAIRLLFNFVHTHHFRLGERSNRGTAMRREPADGDDDGDDDYNDNNLHGFNENDEDELDLWDFDDEDDDDWEEDSGSSRGASHRDRDSPFSDKADKESSFLIKGSLFPHINNPRYEMLEGLDWTSQSLAAIVCGMLNSGQDGTICVGVGKGGEVMGEKVSHDMRDELRLGMDDLMARLVPNIMHFQIQIHFLPVVAAQEGDLDTSLAELFVIEIVCSPIRGVIHTVKNGKAYYRTGNETILVNQQNIRHLIVIDEEQKFMEEIVGLKRRLQILTSSPHSPSPSPTPPPSDDENEGLGLGENVVQ